MYTLQLLSPPGSANICTGRENLSDSHARCKGTLLPPEQYCRGGGGGQYYTGTKLSGGGGGRRNIPVYYCRNKTVVSRILPRLSSRSMAFRFVSSLCECICVCFFVVLFLYLFSHTHQVYIKRLDNVLYMAITQSTRC